ncbi:hypothetical protein ACFWN2_07275 [Lentzea sp. NPDC058436]|uniref:hypothetical protein n=1 Tax=Lentzea sp. NPDC058436 TaxID=3346499 RepID=UPI0036628599
MIVEENHEAAKQRLSEGVVAGRIGRPEEVASTVAFHPLWTVGSAVSLYQREASSHIQSQRG